VTNTRVTTDTTAE